MKQYLNNLTERERLAVMQENSNKVENTTYYKELTEEELATKREELAENCIKLEQVEDEFKAEKEAWVNQIKSLKKIQKAVLIEIKSKKAEMKGTIYHIPDYAEGMMETYDADGVLISSRRLRPDERQLNTFSTNFTFGKAE